GVAGVRRRVQGDRDARVRPSECLVGSRQLRVRGVAPARSAPDADRHRLSRLDGPGGSDDRGPARRAPLRRRGGERGLLVFRGARMAADLWGDLLGAETHLTAADVYWLSPLPLWAGLLSGPTAWGLDLGVSYALVKWACAAHRGDVLRLLSAAALALVAGG